MGGREGGRLLSPYQCVSLYREGRDGRKGVRRGEMGGYFVSLQPTVRKTLSSAMATLSPTKVQ